MPEAEEKEMRALPAHSGSVPFQFAPSLPIARIHDRPFFL